MSTTVPFVALNRYQIRDALLGFWNARYLAATGTPLQIQPGSPAYMEAEGVGVLCEPIQSRAATVANNIFPDTADTDSLNHHGTIDNVPRKSATAAVIQVQINGTALATVTFGTATIQGSNGLTYTPWQNSNGTGGSVTLDGSGHGTVYAICQTAGTVGNLTSGTMTWSSIPTNATSVITILQLFTTAVDVEGDPSYASRIVRNRQARPASGNRSDAEAWMESVKNVAEGYVYPLLQPTTTSGLVLGCWVGVPIGFAPSAPSNSTPSRLLTSGDVTNISNYIEGVADSQGNPPGTPGVGTIQQLRPIVTSAGDYAIQLPFLTTQNVQMHVSLSGISFPGWAPFTTAGGSTNTVINLTSNPTGIISVNDLVAVPDGSANVRGGYTLCTVASVGASSITVNSPGVVSPPVGGLTVYPAPSNWAAMRDAVLTIFDRLGPGDTTDTARRWPPQTVIGPGTLYTSALIAAIQGLPGLPGSLPGVSGVVSCSLVTPNANIVATPLQLIRPGTITFIP